MPATLIAGETADQPDVAELLCLADARAAALYPKEDRRGSSAADLPGLADPVTVFGLSRG